MTLKNLLAWLQPKYPKAVFGTDEGQKYTRIWSLRDGAHVVFLFVDRTNGNILKPDGWRRPAKSTTGSHILANLHEPESWPAIKRVPAM